MQIVFALDHKEDEGYAEWLNRKVQKEGFSLCLNLWLCLPFPPTLFVRISTRMCHISKTAAGSAIANQKWMSG